MVFLSSKFKMSLFFFFFKSISEKLTHVFFELCVQKKPELSRVFGQ